MGAMISRALAAAVAAGVAGGVHRALRARPHQRWQRTDYAGRAVDLYAGPATVVGAAVLPLAPRARAAAVLPRRPPMRRGAVAAAAYGGRISGLAQALAGR
ncbi:hypothetical protein OG963_33900 [Streptomyces sp. NBC_01707]|uniref:hypothetical protein n=1 Tax=unclassified Streptomyces TaxID=2593676 RepID=UPI00352F3830